MRGRPFIALRREGLRRRMRLAALADEIRAMEAKAAGRVPSAAWRRRVAQGRTYAGLIAAEKAAPRRPGRDPRTGYPAVGAALAIDDLGRAPVGMGCLDGFGEGGVDGEGTGPVAGSVEAGVGGARRRDRDRFRMPSRRRGHPRSPYAALSTTGCCDGRAAAAIPITGICRMRRYGFA